MATSKTIVLPEPDQLKKIFQDIGTTEEKIDVEVKTLVEWMRKQPHLPNPDDERRIRMFLIMCKNSLERTKESLDQYYTIKSMVPEFFSDRDPTSPSLVRSMGISIFIPLPKLTPEGHRISLSRLRDPSGIDNYEFLDYVKVNFMSIDIRLSKLDMFKKETFIFDLKHFSLSLLTTVVPHVKKFIYCATTAYPLRIHQVHIVNMPTYAQSMVNMVLGILKKKIASRIMIHDSVEDLKKHIKPELLPLDYGGTFPKTAEEMTDDWIEELQKHKEWFLSQNSVVCDESKRAKKPNVKVNMLAGVEGSFRKLEVD